MQRERTAARKARIRGILAKRQKDLTLVVDNIWDPHNVSAVLRSCDAFGLLRVHLYYTREVLPDLGKKSSGSAKKWVDQVPHDDPETMLAALRGDGFQVLRTGFSDAARPLHAWDLNRPTAVILSNEHDGASPELLDLVPDELYIPMRGMVQSFNVSVAAAIILYEAARQRMDAPAPEGRYLTHGEIEALAPDWEER